MDLNKSQLAKKICFSIIIISLYPLSLLFISNAIIAFLVVLNTFYFSRELFYDRLFIITDFNNTSNLIKEPFPLLKSESDILPENIKKLLRTNDVQLDSSTVDKNNIILISAIQKAECLIDEKIKQLQSKKIITKKEIINFQDDIKSELVKELPEIPKLEDEWIEWSPLALHDKINDLKIYCEKCNKNFLVRDTIYEITKNPDHFKVTTVHQQNDEEHVNTIRITPESFEILSKPVLEIRQSKEVEA